MRTDFETLHVERIDEHVLLVMFDRPEVANARNTRMGLEQLELMRALYVDSEGFRCVVLTGRGDRAFSAGGDLKERDGMTQEDWRRQHAVFEQCVHAMRACPVPIIAAVNGAAFGGGCETALACDFIYASSSARFALTETTLGIMPGCMGTQNLPGAVGMRRAKEIILTGEPFTAEQALAWGLVNRLCAPERLLEETLATARRIAANAPLAIMRAKRAISVADQLDWYSGYQLELEAYNRLIGTEDRAEGVRAFNEGRKPEFKGR